MSRKDQDHGVSSASIAPIAGCTETGSNRRPESETLMEKHLQHLIDVARSHKITPAEQEAQVRSFTYGNTHLENASITREEVDRVVTSLRGVDIPWDTTAKFK